MRSLSLQIDSGFYDALRAVSRGEWNDVPAGRIQGLLSLGLVAPEGDGWRVTPAGMTRLRSAKVL